MPGCCWHAPTVSQNDIANSSYAAAEFSLLGNDVAMAKRQAENALRHNPASSLKLKIDDLLLRIKQIEKKPESG